MRVRAFLHFTIKLVIVGLPDIHEFLEKACMDVPFAKFLPESLKVIDPVREVTGNHGFPQIQRPFNVRRVRALESKVAIFNENLI